MVTLQSRRVQVDLPRNLFAPSNGRAVVRSLLGRDVPSSFMSDALLATSELVSNALEHGHGALEVLARFHLERGLLRVEVSDSSSDVPRPREQLPTCLGGRGLRLVAAVSSDWGWTPNERGKTVWFELTS
jgi:anti-sigma regulatory factor (Ser/Thr protein kinase)